MPVCKSGQCKTVADTRNCASYKKGSFSVTFWGLQTGVPPWKLGYNVHRDKKETT